MRKLLRRRCDRGAIAVEFVVLVPTLFILIALVVAGTRLWWAQTAVSQLASAAARQASISRTASDAIWSAEHLVRLDANNTGLRCGAGNGAPTVQVSAGQFGRPVGEPASVFVNVSCEVPLADLILPGFPGSIRVEHRAESPLDSFRARG